MPTKLTKERVERISKAFRQGLSQRSAAVYGGIALSTLQAWLRDPKKPLEKELRKAVDEAKADLEKELLEDLRQAGRDAKQWQAPAWVLSRKYSFEYGDKTATDMEEKTKEIKDLLADIARRRDGLDS